MVQARTCCFCAKTFTRTKDLIRHLKSTVVHQADKNYACAICGKGFSRPDSMRRHQGNKTCISRWTHMHLSYASYYELLHHEHQPHDEQPSSGSGDTAPAA